MINKTENQIIQHWKSDNSQPIVSICCITYNHENYISQALNSFLMQGLGIWIISLFWRDMRESTLMTIKANNPKYFFVGRN